MLYLFTISFIQELSVDITKSFSVFKSGNGSTSLPTEQNSI